MKAIKDGKTLIYKISKNTIAQILNKKVTEYAVTNPENEGGHLEEGESLPILY